MVEDARYQGSCLCGAVQFRLTAALVSPRYCHCSNCRKFSGSSPAAWAMTEAKHLQSTNASEISRYDSGGGIRCFCATCGSPVWFESKDYPNIVGIPLGSLDSGTVPIPEMELWLASKPAWCSSMAGIARFNKGPE